MRFTSLRLDDFGCFRNARLDDCSADVVVVGGPQRAGKTTFMRAIRQFRAGVRRGDDLPPPTDEYRVDAEVTHDGHGYRYVLDGYAAPSISPLDGGPDVVADDVFGPVTERQYRQLYTISLDELRRLPPGIDDAEDLARVLLGGAYGDVAEIPEIRETFRKRAHDVGLKRGDPSATTTDLHDPYTKIREGMKARREASEQVAEHDAVTEELREKRAEADALTEELEATRRERDRLNVLAELFEPLQRLDALAADLAADDAAAAEEFPTHLTDRLAHFEAEFEEGVEGLADAERAFEREATLATTEAYREWLLDREEDLARLESERKVLVETVDDLATRRRDLSRRRAAIESDVAALRPDWDESVDHLDEVDASAVDAARVRNLSSSVADLRAKREELDGELRSQRTRRDRLREDLSEMEAAEDPETEVSVPKGKPALVAATAVATAIGVGSVASAVVGGPVGPAVAGGLVGLVVVAVGTYAIDWTIAVEPTVDAEPRRELRAQVANLESEIDAAEARLESVESDLAARERELADLASDLGLPESVPASRIPDLYEDLVALDEDLEDYRRDREAWEADRDGLATELRAVDDLVGERADREWSAADPLANAESLLAALEAAAADLRLATAVRDARGERADCVADVDSVLTAWDEERSVDASTPDEVVRRRIAAFRDRADEAAAIADRVEERDRLETQVASRLDGPSAREVFAPLREDDEPWLSVAQRAAEEFADEGAIEDRVRDLRSEIDERAARRDELREECLELERERDRLASEDDLRAAQARIDEGRVEFERVGEAYAVDRIAEELVGRLHERLMADVVHSLVDEASAIFSDVTRAYDGIELAGDLQDLEFRALRSDGPDHGVGELSRATAEQLFLAVRLARIRQSGVELPVVIDDAATNFDPAHVARVFDVVGELAETNQVFFLTCHPEFVNLASTSGPAAQYWSLEDGAFTRVDDAGALERRLRAD